MRKTREIKTRSWVHYGGELVELATLPPEERERIGEKLAVDFYNELWRGKAVFTAENREPAAEAVG